MSSPTLCAVCRAKPSTIGWTITLRGCADHSDNIKAAMNELGPNLRAKYKLEQEQQVQQPQVSTMLPPPVINQPIETGLRTVGNRIHELVNQERKNAGVKELQYDERLESIAYDHAAYLLKNHPTYQDNPHEEAFYTTVASRYRKAGYTGCSATGENAAQFWNYHVKDKTLDWIADHVFQQWWTSIKGHKENMLSSNYKKQGIAIDYDSRDHVYAIQDFCG